MLNIALTFDDETNKILEKASLKTHPDNAYILGKDSIPHLSIVHIEGEEEDAPEYKEILSTHLTSFEFNVPLSAFYVRVKEEDPRMYYGLGTGFQPHLFDLHKNVISLFPNKEFHGEIGLNYFPHVTLGCLEGYSIERADIHNPHTGTIIVKGYLTIGSRDRLGCMQKIYEKVI